MNSPLNTWPLQLHPLHKLSTEFYCSSYLKSNKMVAFVRNAARLCTMRIAQLVFFGRPRQPLSASKAHIVSSSFQYSFIRPFSKAPHTSASGRFRPVAPSTAYHETSS